uniref:Metalloendopeptidase n=1 Tax=Parastrongyloides trichosuri TaxID=131310 RepID=A0A0N4Z4X5_PARTI
MLNNIYTHLIIFIFKITFLDSSLIKNKIHINSHNISINEYYNVEECKQFNYVIYYYIDSNLWKWYITTALNNIEKNTCIYFVRVYSVRSATLHFTWGDRCRSEAICHKIKHRAQKIFLFWSCHKKVIAIQAIVHETLGIYPQHTRPDRDKFVKIQYDNIRPDASSSVLPSLFGKYIYNYSVDNVSYDYGSIMHWLKNAYTKDNRKDTIVATEFNRYYSSMMGQREVVSFNDYKILNYFYCSHILNMSSVKCHYGGYPNVKRRDRCTCPPGLDNPSCSQFVRIRGYHGVIWEECGPVVLEAKIKSENFRLKSKYICFIYVQAPQNKKALVYMKKVIIEDSYPCYSGYTTVEVRYRSDKGAMGLCLCYWDYRPINIVSEDQLIIVLYAGHSAIHEIDFNYRSLEASESIQHIP